MASPESCSRPATSAFPPRCREMAEKHPYQDRETELVGELYRPMSPNGFAVLVVHEADGIGGNVRRRCAQLAQLGYVALAADLHGGGRVLEGEEMRAAVERFRGYPERFRARVGAGFDALAAIEGVDAGRIAAIGYCFGGTAVLELARSGAPARAVASFHGLLTTRAPAPPGQITARIAAYTGALDPLVPPEDVAAFQAEMTAAEADWQLSIYGRAWHSFTNIGVQDSPDPRMRYDPDADAQSWRAALQFLELALA
jgi:dienelactone hydrolase